MRALTRDPETSLFEGTYRVEVIDARNLGQWLHRYLDFSNFFAFELLSNYREVFSDRIANVLQRFGFRSPLGPTAG
jgi:hypothetical protein